jgi:hypothetical protein
VRFFRAAIKSFFAARRAASAEESLDILLWEGEKRTVSPVRLALVLGL